MCELSADLLLVLFQALEQSVCYQTDTLTHVYKTSRHQYQCHVYKLKPQHMGGGGQYGSRGVNNRTRRNR